MKAETRTYRRRKTKPDLKRLRDDDTEEESDVEATLGPTKPVPLADGAK
jgi:hypothetical protein